LSFEAERAGRYPAIQPIKKEKAKLNKINWGVIAFNGKFNNFSQRQTQNHSTQTQALVSARQ